MPITGGSGGTGGGLTQEQADALYIHKQGDTAPTDYFVLKDSSEVAWRISVDTAGHLVTTLDSSNVPGTGNLLSPYFFFPMTYS